MPAHSGLHLAHPQRHLRQRRLVPFGQILHPPRKLLPVHLAVNHAAERREPSAIIHQRLDLVLPRFAPNASRVQALSCNCGPAALGAGEGVVKENERQAGDAPEAGVIGDKEIAVTQERRGRMDRVGSSQAGNGCA
jgi:hypothetical protein